MRDTILSSSEPTAMFVATKLRFGISTMKPTAAHEQYTVANRAVKKSERQSKLYRQPGERG